MTADNFYHDDHGSTREITERERALGMNSRGVFTKPGETIHLCQSGKVRCTIKLAIMPDGTTFAGYDFSANGTSSGGAPNVRYSHPSRQAAIAAEVADARDWLAKVINYGHGNIPAARACLAQLARKYAPISPMPKKQPKPNPSAKLIELACTRHEAFLLSRIYFDHNNARLDGKEITAEDLTPEFIASIARGIKNPLLLREITPAERIAQKIPDQFTHIAMGGNRRRAAALHLDWLTVPATDYGKLTTELADEIADLDNCQRESLTDLDRAQHYAKLVKKHGWAWFDENNPARSLAHRFNLQKSSAYEWRTLANLDKLAAQALASGQQSKSVILQISRVFLQEQRLKLLADAIAEEWTDKEAAEQVAEYLRAIPKDIDWKDKTFTCKRDCETCEFRSGSQANFLGGRGDMCADIACLKQKLVETYDRKAKAWPGTVWTPAQATKLGNLTQDDWKGPAFLSSDYCNLATVGQLMGITGYKGTKQTLRETLGDDLKAKEIILCRTNDGNNTELQIIPRKLTIELLTKRGLIKQPKPKSVKEVKKTPQQLADEAARARAKAIRNHVMTAIVAAAEKTDMAGIFGTPKSPAVEFLRICGASVVSAPDCFDDKFDDIIDRRAAVDLELKAEVAQSSVEFVAERITSRKVKPAKMFGWLIDALAQPSETYRTEVTPADWSDHACAIIHWLELDLITLIAAAAKAVKGDK